MSTPGSPVSPAAAGSAEAAAWLRHYRRQPRAPLRLVCLPHAGGNAAAYRGWAAAFPGAVEVAAVQYPGRLDRIGEPPVGSVEELVAALLPAVTSDPRPVAIFGHSLGALLGYELARAMQRHGPGATHLFVSGKGAPHRLRPGRTHLADDDVLWAELARLGGTDHQLLHAAELRPMVLPALRHDYRLAETYRGGQGEPLRCPVTAVLGDSDPEVNAAEAQAWREVTDGPFRLHVLPGDHFYLQPRRQELLALIGGALHGAPGPAGAPGDAP